MVIEHASWLLPAAREAYKSREEIASGWGRIYATLFGGKKNIAFTGMAGVGKTVLFDHLTGTAYKPGYAPPPKSESAERGKIASRKKRLRVSVIPGQPAFPRLEELDKLFRGKKAVDGVIHVVASGFIDLRNAAAESALVETGVSTIKDFRRSQLLRELEDLEATCEIIRQAIYKHRKPAWMLLAVTKADLYYDEMAEVERYYSPDGRSRFIDRLKELQRQVGTDSFGWDALPVCSWLEDFHWNKQTQPSVLKPNQRDHYLAIFAKRLESYCEL
jgi:hypothetical protein